MVITKKISFPSLIIFLWLVLFPLGQVIRIGILQPIDVVAGLSLVYWALRIRGLRIPKMNWGIFLILAFSLVFSFNFFPASQILRGSLYALRLLAYFAFSGMIFETLKGQKNLKDVLVNSLILVTVFVALFGWLQYFFFPDLRTFTVWGWDDHLFRLVGTFLDPGFTAIILVFGFLLAFLEYLRNKDKKFLFIAGFFLITVAFTYARAGYLALLAGTGAIFILRKKIKWIFFLLLLPFLLLLLPRPSSSGVELERLFSIYNRMQNYRETIQIFRESPLFGVGFNNLCLARQEYLNQSSWDSHACSGSDASLLLILATTGVVGLLLFLDFGFNLSKTTPHNFYGICFLICMVAVLVHSLFVNSLFYPWVLGYLAILRAVSQRE